MVLARPMRHLAAEQAYRADCQELAVSCKAHVHLLTSFLSSIQLQWNY